MLTMKPAGEDLMTRSRTTLSISELLTASRILFVTSLGTLV